jgi:hypothetical protein
MSREDTLANLLRADATLVALLPGGIYTDNELGVEGLRRGEDSPCAAAYDDDGLLVPCAVVRQGGEIPYGEVRNIHDKFVAMSQLIMVYFFEMRGSDIVTQAKLEAYRILEGVRLGETYPIWMSRETAPVPDGGPIANSTMLCQDWMVVFVRQSA